MTNVPAGSGPSQSPTTPVGRYLGNPRLQSGGEAIPPSSVCRTAQIIVPAGAGPSHINIAFRHHSLLQQREDDSRHHQVGPEPDLQRRGVHRRGRPIEGQHRPDRE